MVRAKNRLRFCCCCCCCCWYCKQVWIPRWWRSREGERASVTGRVKKKAWWEGEGAGNSGDVLAYAEGKTEMELVVAAQVLTRCQLPPRNLATVCAQHTYETLEIWLLEREGKARPSRKVGSRRRRRGDTRPWITQIQDVEFSRGWKKSSQCHDLSTIDTDICQISSQ